MTRFLLSFLLCLVAFSLHAQENSYFTIGIGYPFFLGTDKNDDSHYNYNINLANYNVFVEREFQVLKKMPQLRLTPGLAYIKIKETYKNEALGGGGEGYYKHRAFSTYVKLIYELNRQPYIVCDYYFGLQAGYYIDSKSTGSGSSWMVNYNSDEGHYSNYDETDKSGKDFFHSNYFGIIAGIRPLGDAENFIQPNIEFGFYPSFATINSYYVNGEEKKSMFQISVSVGLGNKSRNIRGD
ncbi:hypothetical protein [uncultured Draconibacterium sp.]|uniref:hypothetical protein n=1 Tax=uncultured Draconibacterium sp. TaxID=1573823 RepID=UPI002AA85420|nr:hypothetical protein [uncultured Draconibacterium sp.]